MRRRVLAIAAIWLFAAPHASAAPACWDRGGEPIRCGAPGAMPVGWTPPHQAAGPMDPARDELGNFLKAACVIGVLLCLIALLPEFDGTRNEDWEQKDK
ncbi:MAG TPA: hypothetical protein VMU22_12455 [Rhizomicrobium sp.]|nr:hypothetical protein [Rhizomicrobium sp.]